MPKTRRSRRLPGLDGPGQAAGAPVDQTGPADRPRPADRPGPADRPLSVSEAVRRADALLDRDLGELAVSGELAAFSRPPSGHWHMTLKDAGAELDCVVFRGDNERLEFTPELGERLVAFGRLGLHVARGRFRMVASRLERLAPGAALIALEALKRRLRQEGLFDQARKRPLPAFARHIALLTSPGGAAVHDVVHVLSRRFPAMAVSCLPVSVQGARAPKDLVAAIARANREAGQQRPPFDVILIARGGGGPEDLAAFNEEAVARAIANSALTVVTGIGHEVDHTIADMAADRRAPTPSAAAELLSPDTADLHRRCAAAQQRMRRRLGARLGAWRQRRRDLARRLRDPAATLRERRERLRAGARRMRLASQRRGARQLRGRPAASIHRLRRAMEQAAERAAARWQRADERLRSLGPEETLQRGYAILQRRDGRFVRASADVENDETLSARLGDGSLTLRVTGREAPAPER